jgi:hypothetical protein
MKIRLIITSGICIFIFSLLLFLQNKNQKESTIPKIFAPAPENKSLAEETSNEIFSLPIIENGISLGTGDEHLQALEVIMVWLREQQVLVPEDQALVLNYLQQEKPETLTTGEWEERVNEILNFMRAQPNGVPGLADLMIHMAEKDSNTVLRMYAMQHIFLWIPDEKDQEKREAMMAYLKRVSETPSDIHSGAAVMFLSDLEMREDQKVDVSDEAAISRAALRLVGNAEVNPAARISALHTCTERNVTDALPIAREIAADGSKMIPLRKAAIHAIGQLGNSDDIEILEKLALNSTDLKAAIDPALSKLQSK